ncbi:lysosomal acid phosphatase isoform X2 [Fopius arisanus]|nr:PREDICTED: lysosomal acid phosphatase isoform X2 [Fopius arisanus]XP_011310808.1 PREDICTED: lysosomal acid phosphatase isoform X2 [Fopius arisanus]
MDFSRSFWLHNCRPARRGICCTVLLLGIIVLSTLLAYSAFVSKKDHQSVKQIAIIFRHGARNPTETYAKDPHRNHEWEDGWGALTKEGMQQLYQLGHWLREEYDFVIGEKYYSKTTLVRSSYAERCIMSAQALLAGLFRPVPLDYFVDDLPWRPVPVVPIPRDQDKLIVVKYPCAKLDEALKEAYVNESAESGKEMASYYSQLSYYTGQKIETITDVEFLYNTLEIENFSKNEHGLKLPEWTKKFYNDKMREIAAKSLAIFTSNTLQRRLRGGPLLKEITDNMMRVRNGEDERKLYLYSAHDITLVNVLRAMGFTEELFKPDYGAALIFELVLSEDLEEGERALEVKVKYLNNTDMDRTTPLGIPRCQEPCKLLNLLHVWQNVLPTNWDAECKV